MKPPRFTLRFLLVVVTIAAVGFGITHQLYSKRPLTLRKTENVRAGLDRWQVWRLLGAPHFRDETTYFESWRFEYAKNENLPYDYYIVHFDRSTNRVSHVGRGSYISEK